MIVFSLYFWLRKHHNFHVLYPITTLSYSYTNSTFKYVEPPLVYTVLGSREPHVLDTATRVFVWIPSSRAGMNGLPIAEVTNTKQRGREGGGGEDMGRDGEG